MHYTRTSKIILYGLFISAVFLFLPLLSPEAYARDVVIICHKDVPGGPLSKNILKNIFTGRKRVWSDGQQIIFVISKNEDLHKNFCLNYINKTPAQFNAYWKKMLFTGKGQLPKFFEKEKDMIDFVAKTPGAIGYVSADLKSDQVKTLEVN